MEQSKKAHIHRLLVFFDVFNTGYEDIDKNIKRVAVEADATEDEVKSVVSEMALARLLS